jgi:hypothetical protein
MHRAALLLLLVLGGAWLASCGKGGSASSRDSTSAHGASGSSAGPSKSPFGDSLSRQRAFAFAHAVNLTPEDVPGFRASEKHDNGSAREKRLEREMAHCAAGGGPKLPGEEHKALADQSSKDFQLKHGIIDFSVSSQVSVQSSAAEARRGLQAIRSARVRNCFSHSLQLLFNDERLKGATPGPVTIQGGVPPAPGTTGGFGWRVTANFLVRGVKIPIYLDFLGFVEGPAEVTLLSSGLIRPFPAEVQQHLFALLLARAKAHAL